MTEADKVGEQNEAVERVETPITVEEFKTMLAQEQQKTQEHWDRLLRKEAEHQNTVRRLTHESENIKKFAVERFASDLLTVVDSLERGLAAVPEGMDASLRPLRDGMELTLKQLLQVLEKASVTSFNPEKQVFDPQFHAALSTQETEEFPPNHVTLVVQKGYLLQGRLLRAASVIVSKAKESASPGA